MAPTGSLTGEMVSETGKISPPFLRRSVSKCSIPNWRKRNGNVNNLTILPLPLGLEMIHALARPDLFQDVLFLIQPVEGPSIVRNESIMFQLIHGLEKSLAWNANATLG
jgi:hypothetical protein